MKKLLLIVLMLSFTACSSVTDKISKPNTGECPPQSERTIGDIFCTEPK